MKKNAELANFRPIIETLAPTMVFNVVPSCWGYQTAFCVHNWFEMDCCFPSAQSLVGLWCESLRAMSRPQDTGSRVVGSYNVVIPQALIKLRLVPIRRSLKNSLFLYLVLCAQRERCRNIEFFTLRLQSTPNGNQP